jgi:hypothetical protein
MLKNGEKRLPQSQAWQVAEAQKHRPGTQRDATRRHATRPAMGSAGIHLPRQGEQPEAVPGPQHEADGLLQVAVPKDAQGISACIQDIPWMSRNRNFRTDTSVA